MSLQVWEFLGTPIPKAANNFSATNPNPYPSKRNHTATFRCASELAFHGVSADGIAGVLHNKVLVAAGLSAAIGQLSKPFTSTLFYGKKFDFKATVQAGGFPSTHSSAAVASATSLLIERGFSDSVFGFAVIYACLTMYDAQGVRREVGTHAKEINKALLQTTSYSKLSRNGAKSDSFSEESSSNIEKMELRRSPLKESIGHTEVEVAAGALLGFLVWCLRNQGSSTIESQFFK